MSTFLKIDIWKEIYCDVYWDAFNIYIVYNEYILQMTTPTQSIVYLL